MQRHTEPEIHSLRFNLIFKVVFSLTFKFAKYCVDRKQKIDELKSRLSEQGGEQKSNKGASTTPQQESPPQQQAPVGGKRKKKQRRLTRKKCIVLRIPKRYTKNWRKYKKQTRRNKKTKRSKKRKQSSQI